MSKQGATETPKKKSGKLGPIMATVGALTLICVVGIGSAIYQDSTPAGQATNTAEAIARESTQAAKTAESVVSAPDNDS